MKKAVLTTNDFNRLIYTTRDFTTTYGKPCYQYIKLDVDAEKHRITAAGAESQAARSDDRAERGLFPGRGRVSGRGRREDRHADTV